MFLLNFDSDFGFSKLKMFIEVFHFSKQKGDLRKTHLNWDYSYFEG